MVDLNEARERAARVAARADLVDIRLFNVEAALERLPDDLSGLGYSFNANVEVQHVEETSVLIVDGTYELDVTDGDADSEDDGEASTLATLKFKQAALFSVGEPDAHLGPYRDEELDAFGRTTGQLALHPYAREFIFGITGRMGLPPLHIGMMLIPLDKELGNQPVKTLGKEAVKELK